MPIPLQPESLILASASPRRAQLMREAGYDFRVIPPSIDEPRHVAPSSTPEAHVEALAYFKARNVALNHPGTSVLGADTVAVLDHEIIGKPSGREDAEQILRRLSGSEHQVVTGIALMQAPAGRRMITHEISVVVVRNLSDAWIARYLDSGAWQGKAGAYGIQEDHDEFAARIEGSFSNIVGLPMERLRRVFASWCTPALATR